MVRTRAGGPIGDCAQAVDRRKHRSRISAAVDLQCQVGGHAERRSWEASRVAAWSRMLWIPPEDGLSLSPLTVLRFPHFSD